MTPSLKAFIEHYAQHVDTQLLHRLDTIDSGDKSDRLFAAMRYSLLDGGKRIRPVLVYAGASAVGNVRETTDRAACAVECIHAYSLVHDDLPAMDDDDLRRGKPTCHVAFDEATAILAGDALQNLAFEILANGADNEHGVSLALVRELGRAAGARGMVAGQAIDLAAVDQTLTLEQLEHMHRHKTGALIEASVVMGALSSGMASPEQIEALRVYARAIGLAFQVHDDILDVTVETTVLGKRQGADQERNKPTYVALLGLEEAQRKARELHEQALQALSGFDARADHLRHMASYIVERRT
jgi:geranylgeranyl diphosphate synthase type II